MERHPGIALACDGLDSRFDGRANRITVNNKLLKQEIGMNEETVALDLRPTLKHRALNPACKVI